MDNTPELLVGAPDQLNMGKNPEIARKFKSFTPAQRQAAGKALRDKAPRLSHGQRVVSGQRLIQPAPDIFLGWYNFLRQDTGDRVDFYVRQLRDMKGSVTFEPGRWQVLDLPNMPGCAAGD